jgi:hypothetical protein
MSAISLSRPLYFSTGWITPLIYTSSISLEERYR